MKHYQIVPYSYKLPKPTYYVKQKHLVNPVTDVICVAVLAVVLFVAWYMHLTAGF